MPSPIIQGYLDDDSIDVAKRKKLFEDLSAGKVDENGIEKAIINKYGTLYGDPEEIQAKNDTALRKMQIADTFKQGAKNLITNTSLKGMREATPQEKTKMIANAEPLGKILKNVDQNYQSDLEARNKSGSEWDAYQKDILTGARKPDIGYEATNHPLIGPIVQGVQGFGEGVKNVFTPDETPSISPTLLTAKLSDPNVSEEEKQSLRDQFKKQGETIRNKASGLIGGGVGLVASPFSAALNIAPVPNEAKAGLGSLFSVPGEVAKQAYEDIAPMLGADKNSEQFQKDKELIANITNAALLAHGAKKGAKMKSLGKVNEGLVNPTRAGILEALGNEAKTVMPEKPSMLSNLVSKFTKKPEEGLPLENGEPVAPQKPGLIKKIVRQAPTAISGLDPETIRLAIENPDLLTEAQKTTLVNARDAVAEAGKIPIDKKISSLSSLVEGKKSDIFAKVKGGIDTKLADIADTGKEYEAVRKSKTSVVLSDKRGNSWFENVVQNEGLTIENGKIKANSESAIRKPSEVAALQGLYDTYGKKTRLSGNEFLNFREDVRALKYDQTSNSPAMKGFSDRFAAKLNEKGRTQLPSLADADAKYSPLKESLKKTKELIYDKKTGTIKPGAEKTLLEKLTKGVKGDEHLANLQSVVPDFKGLLEDLQTHQEGSKSLKGLKKLLYDSDGNLKSNAISTLNNIFNKGQEGKLAQLKEVMGKDEFNVFERKVKIAKALEDIEITKNNKIGTYAHNILSGASWVGLAANPVAAVMGIIMTNPDVMVSILKSYGKLRNISGKYVEGLANRIMEGKSPVGAEAVFVRDAILTASQGLYGSKTPTDNLQ